MTQDTAPASLQAGRQPPPAQLGNQHLPSGTCPVSVPAGYLRDRPVNRREGRRVSAERAAYLSGGGGQPTPWDVQVVQVETSVNRLENERAVRAGGAKSQE